MFDFLDDYVLFVWIYGCYGYLFVKYFGYFDGVVGIVFGFGVGDVFVGCC